MKIRRAIIFLSLLFAVALLQRCSKNPASSQQEIVSALQSTVNAIMPDVAKLRGLDFIRPVHIAATTRSAYGAYMQKQITQAFSSSELQGLSKEYAQMGFLTEADTPLIKILIDYYSGFPAAYYVPGTDSMYILTDANTDDNTIAHELTHALQDQNLDFSMTIFPDYSHFSSDARLAQTSLIEGDAMFTEYAYAFSKAYPASSISPFDSSRMVGDYYKNKLTSATYPFDAPLFLNVRGMSPYLLGMSYIGARYAASSNWSGVNALFTISMSPRSSATINEESAALIRYFEFHAIQELLVGSQRSISFADDDNAGFALLLGLFYGALDTARVSRSLDWSGDRYTFVKYANQPYGTLVWALAFANADGAGYAFGKVDSLLRNRRLGGLTAAVDSLADSTGGGVTYTYAAALDTAQVRRTGNQVWWLENTGSLTRPIMSILTAQQTLQSPPMPTHASAIPVTLSSGAKKAAVTGLLKHLFKR